ncbi:hypothetical protein AYO38_02675 [bacterium SCGC AG-212-C10]|nr:hypothetical protein AYO38_02675 [bacterium SCGC AG-212-C10]
MIDDVPHEKQPAELISKTPGEGLRYFTLSKAQTTIGSGPDRDIVLEGLFVSRRHAVIERRDDGYWLQDSGSTNGVLINGSQLEPSAPALLRHQDRIDFAGRVVIFWIRGVGTPLFPVELLENTPPLPEPFEVDSARRVVRFRGEVLNVRMSPLEFALVLRLYEQRHRVCSKDELGEALWGAPMVNGRRMPQYDDNMLHVKVHNAKAKLAKASPGLEKIIVSVPGAGYRLDIESLSETRK